MKRTSIFTAVAGALGFVPRSHLDSMQRTVRTARRAFAAAQQTRLTATWQKQNLSIDQDLRQQLPVMRARSRDLSYNESFAKRFLQLVEGNVVGPKGVAFQVRAKREDGTLDEADNNAIEEAHKKWARRGVCEVSGKLSLRDLERLLIRTAARDGEYLYRKIRNPSVNEFGFAVQVLDVDRIVTDKNEELANGNVIKMGVEMGAGNRAVAYHLYTKHPGENVYYTYQHGHIERVPAEDIGHGFIAERPEQTRGIPWMYASMKRLWDLGAYDESAIVAARIGAAKMGFFKSPDGDANPLADDKDEDGTLYTEADPGQFGMLPPGYDFAPFNPEYPHAMYAPFHKAMLRGIASGLGVAYNGLGNDLEGVNFSSIRQGVLDERDVWMGLQEWFIEQVKFDLATEWLRMGLLSGAIKGSTGKPLPMSKFDKFNAFMFRGRRWQWVDPEKDVAANVNAINNNLKSRREVVEELGGDWDDLVVELEAEKKLLEEKGLWVEQKPPAEFGGGAGGFGKDKGKDKGKGKGDEEEKADEKKDEERGLLTRILDALTRRDAPQPVEVHAHLQRPPRSTRLVEQIEDAKGKVIAFRVTDEPEKKEAAK